MGDVGTAFVTVNPPADAAPSDIDHYQLTPVGPGAPPPSNCTTLPQCTVSPLQAAATYTITAIAFYHSGGASDPSLPQLVVVPGSGVPSLTWVTSLGPSTISASASYAPASSSLYYLFVATQVGFRVWGLGFSG